MLGLSKILKNTHASHVGKKGDVNSIISLLSIESAKIPDRVKVTNDTSIILKSISEINRRLTGIESDVLSKASERQFKAGDSVLHPKFGTGEIVAVSGFGEKEEVSVRFQSSGVKKMLVKFANLEHFIPTPNWDDFPPEEEDLPF